MVKKKGKYIKGFSKEQGPAERFAFKFLLACLPPGYKMLCDFELVRNNKSYNYDLVLIAKHNVFVLDIKGCRSNIEIESNQTWQPAYGDAFSSPFAGLREKAKILSSIINEDLKKKSQNANEIWVHAAVLMTAKDAAVGAKDEKQPDILFCSNEEQVLEYFEKNHAPKTNKYKQGLDENSSLRIYDYLATVISNGPNHGQIQRKFKNWLVETLLESNGDYFEYLAIHEYSKRRRARLRFYEIELDLAEELFQEQLELRLNAFRLVRSMPYHKNILQIEDFFLDEDEDQSVLVLEYFPGKTLETQDTSEPLAFETKLEILRQALEALAHAHKHGVIHRDLSPRSILIKDKQVKITPFDFGTDGNPDFTVSDKLEFPQGKAYRAPECLNSLKAANVRSDLYSLGLIFFEFLSGQNLSEISTEAGLQTRASQFDSKIPGGIDHFLFCLANKNPALRFQSASAALAALEFALLKPGSIISERFELIEELACVQGVSATYTVKDLLAGNTERILKIALRSAEGPFSLTEFEIIPESISSHDNVAKPSWQGTLDGRLFTVFDQDISASLAKHQTQKLSKSKLLETALELCRGLAHLHRHKIAHRHLCPENIFFLKSSQSLVLADFDMSPESRRYYPENEDRKDLQKSETLFEHDLHALSLMMLEYFSGKSPDEILALKSSKSISGDSESERQIQEIFARMLLPARKQQFRSATELLAALESLKTFYPLAEARDYRKAFSSDPPRNEFEDDILRNGRVLKDESGIPVDFAFLNFSLLNAGSVVYQLARGGFWAIKCFLQDDPNLSTRYKAIIEKLDEVQSAFFPAMQFLTDAIQISEAKYPILKMQWFEGLQLDRYIKQHKNQPGAIVQLAKNWQRLHKLMSQEKIAHGDLQAANILVAKDSSLKLVDLDGMYVSGLDGLESPPGWHLDYQHPERRLSFFNPKMDHFSAWLIFASLRAYALEPRLEVGDGYLLFNRDDFKAGQNSKTLKILLEHFDPELVLIGKFLQSLFKSKLSQIPGPNELAAEFSTILFAPD